MEIITLPLDKIQVGDRLRAVDTDTVALLIESLGVQGQMNPIQVRTANLAGVYDLIAGAHRIAALRAMGLSEVQASVYDVSDIQARMMEVEENLIRRELNELDRAVFLAEHKSLWETLHPETKHGGDKRRKASSQDANLTPHPLTERFAAAAAKKLGWSEATIQRAVRRHRMLSPAIRARIANTWIAENGAALDDLIGRGEALTEAEQNAVLDLLLEPSSKGRNVNQALRLVRNLPSPDTSDGELNALKAAWKRAGARARRDFRAFLAAEGGN